MYSKEYLSSIFRYDDGILYWKAHPTIGHRINGTVAGYTRDDGYVFVHLMYESIAVHKIIYCMFTDEWVKYPDFEIDHKDKNTSNNKIDNLRKVTKSQNQDNTSCRGNSTGVKGVYFDSHHKMFKAIICVDSKLRHLGYYDELEQAVYIRKQAEGAKREGDFDSWYLSKREELLGTRIRKETQSHHQQS